MKSIDLLSTTLIILFFISIVAIYYIYDGYGRLLEFIVWRKKGKLHSVICMSNESIDVNDCLFLSVIIAVHNEEHQIAEKISDVLNTKYLRESIEVLVVSDHSTDRTEEIVKDYSDVRVHLIIHLGNRGKSAAQNVAVQKARGEVLVFTDADTRFTPNFLYKISQPLTNTSVGAVDGHLIFVSPECHDPAHRSSQSLYWKYELRLRHLESELGMLAVTSGACLAVRRELFKTLPLTVGEDCVVPLDVVTAGRKVVHADCAVAYDVINEDLSTEFKARVRMTLRNWEGTWRYTHLLNPLLNPTYACALWSHKILRWLSPIFLCIGTITALYLALNSIAFTLISVLFVIFYLMGVIGWLSVRYDIKQIPLSNTILSFLMVNLCFLIGLLSFWRGKTIKAYTNKVD